MDGNRRDSANIKVFAFISIISLQNFKKNSNGSSHSWLHNFQRCNVFWQLFRNALQEISLTLFSLGKFLLGCNCVLPVSFAVYSSSFCQGFCVELSRYCGGIFQIEEEVMPGWPQWERRTLKPVIIIPPQGTSSHAALHYNPSYHKAQVYHLQNYFRITLSLSYL